MRRLLKWLLILGVLAGLVAAVAVPTMSWLKKRSVPRYLTATVSRGRVETVVNSTGTIKPVRTVSVGAFTSGPIEEVYVDYNSEVAAGAELARIDQKLAKAALERDEAAVESQKATLEAQKADLTRIEALLQQAKNNESRARQLLAVNKDYLSETDMDTYLYTRLQNEAQVRLAKATINQGKAAIRQAEANRENSKANLEYTHIVSPEAGTVIDRKVDKGQTVAASFQTPELFTIAPEMDKHMYVYASVDEADIGQISAAKEQNRPVKFTVDAYPGELFKGHVHQIRNNATTTQNVVTYPVVIEAPNPGRKLRPNMTANISFQIEVKEDVVRIPASALRFVPLAVQVQPEDRHYLDVLPTNSSQSKTTRSADEKAEQARSRQHRHVWIQDGPLLRAVPVTLGLIDNQFAELVEGDLTDGQEVVTGTESALVPR